METTSVRLTFSLALGLALVSACGSVSGLKNNSDSGATTDTASGETGGSSGGGGGAAGDPGGAGGNGTAGASGNGGGGATGATGIRLRGSIGAVRPPAAAAGVTVRLVNPRIDAPGSSSCGPAVCLVRGGIVP